MEKGVNIWEGFYRGVAQLHITCRMTLCFSVCAPSHLARSWVQRAKVFGGSLVLFRNFTWNASLFFSQVCRWERFPASHEIRLCCYIQFCSQLKLRVDWHSLALQYKITQTSFFVCICFGAEAFYLVFLSPCSTQYNVRGLKTMSRMCHCWVLDKLPHCRKHC